METEHYLIAANAILGLFNLLTLYRLSRTNFKAPIKRVTYPDGGTAWADKDDYIINSTTKPLKRIK